MSLGFCFIFVVEVPPMFFYLLRFFIFIVCGEQVVRRLLLVSNSFDALEH